VIARRINLMRHNVGDHAVLHRFCEALGEILSNRGSNLCDGCSALRRERAEVGRDALGVARHVCELGSSRGRIRNFLAKLIPGAGSSCTAMNPG
jgi:hypothetical protein